MGESCDEDEERKCHEPNISKLCYRATEMKLSDLLKSVVTLTGSEDGISWYPIRPQTAENTFLIPRAKAAWRVLTGKSDAVEWDFPINKEQK